MWSPKTINLSVTSDHLKIYIYISLWPRGVTIFKINGYIYISSDGRLLHSTWLFSETTCSIMTIYYMLYHIEHNVLFRTINLSVTSDHLKTHTGIYILYILMTPGCNDILNIIYMPISHCSGDLLNSEVQQHASE